MSKHEYQLSHVVSVLSKHHQRATYSAVGGLIGLPARSVMAGQKKDPENSWVVTAKTKKPTGYLPHEIHPNLEERANVITTHLDLANWLRHHK
mgnify:CR=1 FL=1